MPARDCRLHAQGAEHHVILIIMLCGGCSYCSCIYPCRLSMLLYRFKTPKNKEKQASASGSDQAGSTAAVDLTNEDSKQGNVS